jgi:Cytochrome c3
MKRNTANRRRQNIGYATGILLGFGCFILLSLPEQQQLHARGPMNTGHENFKCVSCHKPAPGSIRQQIQASVNYWIGKRATQVDFGHRDVANEICLACHERPNDRHPVYRFVEPRFYKAREKLRPQFCISCHLEHQGRRVTLSDSSYCVTCHEETRLKNDPVDIPHEQLVRTDRWETCLGCHDFHGNHVMKTKTAVRKVWDSAKIQAYFEGGRSPYPRTVHHRAKTEKDLNG